jgi:uncharacterized protein YggU (UPF0235/DUF167 family)
VRLAVRVTPRGGREAIEGWMADAEGRPVLKVRVAAAPTDGGANTAVIALLAKALGRPKSSLAIVSGQTARVKLIDLGDVSPAALAAAFGTPG